MPYAKSNNNLKEDAPTNNAGGGNIAGIGVGPQGEPGIPKKKRKLIPRIKAMLRNKLIEATKCTYHKQ